MRRIGRGRSAIGAALALAVIAGAGIEVSPAVHAPVSGDDFTALADLERMTLAEGPDEIGRASAAFAEARVLPGQMLSPRRYLRAMALRRALAQSAPGAFRRKWTFLGPTTVGGRIRTIAIDPRDGNVIYTGGVAGGVWKSTDGGTTWKAITERYGNVSVSDIVIDPRDPNVIYVGTGEINNSRATPTAGIGILKTTDAGASWRILPSTVTDANFRAVQDIVLSPNDPKTIYAATVTGIMRSHDGGLVWELTPLHSVETAFPCEQLTARTDRNPDELMAVCPFLESSIWRSTDGGSNWSPVLVESLDAATRPRLAWARVAYAPSHQDVVYASVSRDNSSTLGLFRSDQAGAAGTWSQVSAFGYLNYCNDTSGQGYYANALAVDPTDSNRLWVGGVDGFRSEDGGRTLVPAAYWFLNAFRGDGDGSSYVHADYHGIVYDPGYDGGANQKVYFATDGGVFRTSNDREPEPFPNCQDYNAPDYSTLNTGVKFDGLSEGLNITQFWGGSVSADGALVMGGTQDNGTYMRTEGGGPNDWAFIQGGDGMMTAMAPDRSAFYGLTPGERGIYPTKSTTGQPDSFQSASAGIRDVGLFTPPFVMDPNDQNRLWIGGLQLWRTDDAAGLWKSASPQLVRPGFGAGISAIAVAPANSDVVYAGCSDGSVWVTTNGTTSPTWTNVTGPLPTGANGRVGWIAVDPRNPAVAYVTHTFFGVGHVWKTTDMGASWTNIDGTLPDVPMTSVAINPRNPDMVFLGTDVGVWESANGGATWYPSGSNVQPIYILDLEFRRETSELYVFTHGRGAYMVDVGT